jgi:glycosyltransferase involved in cell wall biosynthesis
MYKKDKNPLVSIIIPCYNYGQYIEKCIQSALDQTYKNIEVVVVDNGSTDDSLKKINTFSNNIRVKIIKLRKNIPPGTELESAVGIAINKSNGEYISILYADDWYLEDKIKEQVDLFGKIQSSVGVVYCHGYRYFEEDKAMYKLGDHRVRGYIFRYYLKNGDIAIPISPLVKRYCYEIIGLDNPWTGSEYDFFVMSQYVDFDYVDKRLIVMRMHNNNDAKNILSVYKRVKLFHSIFLLNSNTILRGGSLIRKRMATDFISFGLTLIITMDMKNGRSALIEAIKVYPICAFRAKVIVSLLLSFIPIFVSKRILTMFGSLDSNNK